MELRTVLSFAAPYRYRLILVGVLTLASSLATLTIPWLAGQMAGGMLTPNAGSQTWLVTLLLSALALIALLNFAVSWISGATAARLLADLRMRIYQHLQSLPLEFHENHRQGDTLALMTYEIASLGHFLTGTLVAVPPLLLTVVGAVILMFRIDPTLSLLVPLLVPAFYLILKLVGRRLRGLARSLQQAEADVVGIAEENLEMLPAIKAFTRETVEALRYQAQVNHAMGLTLQQSRINAALEPLIGLIAASAALLLMFLAGRSVQAGQLTPAQLFSFLFYAALLTRPVGSLANVYGQIQTTRGTLARLQSVLAREPEPGYNALGRMAAAQGEIIFKNVSFAYPGREPTLRNVNLHIRPGEIVALTGPNGAGKTTLMNLLLRLHDPDSGAISVDGLDITRLAVRDLRRQIGIVPQRALLFNGTVRANIGFGLEGASYAQVKAAARLAQADEFICDLPQGYETEIGDHGVRLSGGQRQRIALARAFVKDPPIMILDEATSMYDLDGESAFIEACGEALNGRTVILITHRPASLALAGRVLRVGHGAVRELSLGEMPQPGARG